MPRGKKKDRGRPGAQPSTNLRLRLPPRFTGGGRPSHDHELGEGLEAEGVSDKNPIDAGSVTTVMIVRYGIFPMGGYDIAVPGYRRTFLRAEPDSKDDR